MADRKWTKPQHDAIVAKGGSLLLSAAAGSGKTAVLVERAIRFLCDEENPVPADRLLVVTFSNAAAAEMKQRMNARLSAMIAADPVNLHLQRQQALLQGAQISTIHSFCLELIRQNFQNLDISPDFMLADEQEMQIMEQDCARDCIEEFYEEDETGLFHDLVELLSSGRDDRNLIDTILKIYRFSRSHPFYEDWLDSKLELYNPSVPVTETIWGRTILDYVTDSLGYCQQLMESALDLVYGDEALEKGYLTPFQSDLAQINECLQAAWSSDWDGVVDQLARFEFVRLGAVRGTDTAKEQAKSARDRSKKIITDLAKKYMNASAADYQQDIADLQPKIQVLFELVKRFGRHIWEVKGAKKRLDFSDLEHLALTLLVQKSGGSYQSTPKAEEIAARYEMVMVDEYQDTNEVQDLIFSSVSRKQTNLFMVGDVKQSIYGFRQAMPEIFLKKKQVFFPYDTGMYPAKINLDTNFRSRSQVTGSVNYLFSMLMSNEIGEMEYGEEESLKCGAQYPPHEGMAPEFLLLEREEDSGADTALLEAAAVAQKIAGMLESGFLVTEDGIQRPARPGDFCILLRSHKLRADVYTKELARLGIPAWAETTGGYLQAREVSAVVSFLKALDNPLLDIELVAALLSPLFSFTDDDIAQIRLERKGVPFYHALSVAAENGNGKAQKFLETFRHLRMRSAVLSADQLVMEVYDTTNIIPVVRSMNIGEVRAANLRLLIEYAASYHRMGYKRLGGFVGFLNRLQDRGGDLAPAGVSGQAGSANTVRVMSIHKSKGLEFPVVILADSFRQFNKMDLRASTMLHSRYGFACVRRERGSMRQYVTVPMQAIRLEAERSLLSEELRILYVALTRAKEKLIISGLYKNKLPKRLADLSNVLQGGKLPTYGVRESNCYADWILMALLHHVSGYPLRELAGMDTAGGLDGETPWAVSIQTALPPQEDGPEKSQIVHTAAPNQELLRQLHASASFRYPYRDHVAVPAKLAVSAVAKGEQNVAYRFSARPKFLTDSGLTGAEKGNALHKFMQFADYQAAKTDLAAEIKRMESGGYLSHIEVSSLSKPKLKKFFHSDLAKRIFSSEKVMRELKFTAECGKTVLGDYLSGLDDEAKVVLQGVADCVFYEKDGAVIVDYKTDVVQSEEELVKRYAVQLELYRRILSQSLEKPVSQCLLYSFHLGREVEVQ